MIMSFLRPQDSKPSLCFVFLKEIFSLLLFKMRESWETQWPVDYPSVAVFRWLITASYSVEGESESSTSSNEP